MSSWSERIAWGLLECFRLFTIRYIFLDSPNLSIVLFPCRRLSLYMPLCPLCLYLYPIPLLLYATILPSFRLQSTFPPFTYSSIPLFIYDFLPLIWLTLLIWRLRIQDSPFDILNKMLQLDVTLRTFLALQNHYVLPLLYCSIILLLYRSKTPLSATILLHCFTASLHYSANLEVAQHTKPQLLFPIPGYQHVVYQSQATRHNAVLSSHRPVSLRPHSFPLLSPCSYPLSLTSLCFASSLRHLAASERVRKRCTNPLHQHSAS